MSKSSDSPRYATLQDYLRVVRSQRLLILLFLVVFAGAGYLISAAQKKEYTGEAQLSFRDPTQDLNLFGSTALPEQTAAERAAANADTIDRPQVTIRVRKQLKTKKTIKELQSMVSAKAGARTNFVLVHATSHDPKFAAAVANAYGRQIGRIERQAEQKKIDSAIKALKKQEDSKSPLQQVQAGAQRQQLETIKNIIQPVQVERAAEVPTTPTNPKPVRNTVLGAIVGLAFGLLAAFARDSLDRRLRASHEVHEELGLPILGRISDAALGFAWFQGNGHDPENADLEAFRVLRTNLEFLKTDKPLRSIVVTSGLPGEGKSTVAASLASASVLGGKRTLLVECDLRRPSLAERLGVNKEPGLTDYLVGRASPHDILQTVSLPDPNVGNGSGGSEPMESYDLVCITSGSIEEHPAELLGSARFRDFLTKVSKVYDLVVLDTSPLLAVVDALELVPHVDAVLMCVRLSQTTRDEAKAALSALSHLPERPTGLVVTGMQPGEEYYGYYYQAYGS